MIALAVAHISRRDTSKTLSGLWSSDPHIGYLTTKNMLMSNMDVAHVSLVCVLQGMSELPQQSERFYSAYIS